MAFPNITYFKEYSKERSTTIDKRDNIQNIEDDFPFYMKSKSESKDLGIKSQCKNERKNHNKRKILPITPQL